MTSTTVLVVADDAYDRMLGTLRAGAPFVYTYRNFCPHAPTGPCQCVKFKNVLMEDKVYRDWGNSSFQRVYSLTMYLNGEADHN